MACLGRNAIRGANHGHKALFDYPHCFKWVEGQCLLTACVRNISLWVLFNFAVKFKALFGGSFKGLSLLFCLYFNFNLI